MFICLSLLSRHFLVRNFTVAPMSAIDVANLKTLRPYWSTLQNLAKVGFTAGEILCLHFPAVGPQLDSLNQPGVHHGKLI